MEFMADKSDNYYDLAIVDPPYGINRGGQVKSKPNEKNTRHGGKKYFEHKNWDKKTPDKKYFNELFRISENQIIWGGNYFVDMLKNNSGWIVWDKMQRGFNSDGELAYTSFDRALQIISIQRGVFATQNTIHPTEKPYELYRWLLKNYAKPGQKILDTHGGSMSIAIACHDMGFDLDLCELDPDYFLAGKKRYENHIKQLKFF